MNTILQSAAVLALACAGATGQVVLPNECEVAGASFQALEMTPGGVASFGAEISTMLVHSGRSLACWGTFDPNPGSPSAGFTIGAKEIARPALTTPARPGVVGLAILVPDLRGRQLVLRVAIHEDDNDDGVFDGTMDDEWTASVALDRPGVAMINIPVSAFVDSNPGAGSGAREFDVVKRIALLMTFETRDDLPGGMIDGTVRLWVDHVGIFEAPQTLPHGCRADFDGVAGLGVADILAFLGAWFRGEARADFDDSGALGTPDIFAYLGAWFAGCPG